MIFSKEDCILIKALRQDKHYGSEKLIKMFPQRQWYRQSLDELLRQIHLTRAADRRRMMTHPSHNR